jgi:hypothetical protein
VGKLEARLLATAALWVQIQTSLKIQNGDISIGVANTLARQKNMQKCVGYCMVSGRGDGDSLFSKKFAAILKRTYIFSYFVIK